MLALNPRFRRLVPAVSLVTTLLVAPAFGFAQRFGGGLDQKQGSGGSVQTPPPAKGSGQAPPGQSGQRTPERFLGSTWWKDDNIRKELNLTERQVQRINGIFESRVRQITPFHNDYLKQLAELDRMTVERVVDEATYTIQVGRVEALRSKLSETRTVMLYRFYRELDPAQYQKLQEIWNRRRGRGGPPTPKTW